MALPRIHLDDSPRTLLPVSEGWPRALDALRPAPPVVHLVGHLAPGPRVAIVGTRQPDPEAAEHAWTLGRELASLGCTIVSGGARGIDAAAHRGALTAGSTIAVLATGLERAYPPEHAELFASIARAGALLAEERHASPERWRFLRRNRLIAALADALVVVQAPARSGALSTAAVARSLGRAVFATPAAPWDARGAGCLRLLRAGSELADLERIARSVGLEVVSSHRQARTTDEPRALAELDPACRRVYESLGVMPRHVDELADATGLEASSVQRALTFLRLAALVEDRGDGLYVQRR